MANIILIKICIGSAIALRNAYIEGIGRAAKIIPRDFETILRIQTQSRC